MGTTKNSLEDVANEIKDQMLEIRRKGSRPAYVILDRGTWLMVRGPIMLKSMCSLGINKKTMRAQIKYVDYL